MNQDGGMLGGGVLETSSRRERAQRQPSSLLMAVPIRSGSGKAKTGGASAWHSFRPLMETH